MSKALRFGLVSVAGATAAVAFTAPSLTAQAEPAPKASCEVSVLPGQVENKHGAYNVDKSGEYVGGLSYNGDGVKQATLWKGDELIVIEVPDSGESQIEDVNSAGQAVGTSWDSQGKSSVFSYVDGKVTILEAEGADSIQVAGISEDGQIAGTVADSPKEYHPALWSIDEPTKPRALEVPEGASAASAYDISAAGVVAGVAQTEKQRPFKWDDEGKPSEIPVPADDPAENYTLSTWEDGWGLGSAITGNQEPMDLRWSPDADEPEEYTAINLPLAISATGHVTGTEGGKPVMVTPEGDTTELPLPDGFTEASPSGVNADGSVMAGVARGEGSTTVGVKWTCS